MPGQLVGAGASLNTAPLESSMLDTYDIEYEASKEVLGQFTEFTTSANDRETKFVYFDSVPALKYQAYYTPISSGSYTSIQYTVENYIYSTKIPWSKWDVEDDQTGAMLDHANGLGARAGQIIEELVYQVINQTTDADLLQSIPTAADGSALVISSSRFGVSTGNLVNGTTTTPGDAATGHSRWYAGLQLFTQMQDTKGKRLHSGSVIKGGRTLVLTNELDRQVWEEAFFQTRFQGTSAAPSNVLHDTNKGPDLESTTMIDDGKAFCVLLDAKKKPLLVADRTPFRSADANDQNSDHARATGNHSTQGEMRVGIGANVPYGLVQIVDS